MKDFFTFFTEIGKLKKMPRRGWIIRNIKNPESIAEHTFRVTVMAWFLADAKKAKLNIEKILKMALIHDLCEVYAGDTTPYDSILSKDEKKRKELLRIWPRFTNAQKQKLAQKKYKKEKEGLKKLVKDLPHNLKNEVTNLWLDYEKGLTLEGRFFKQIDRLESFLQALEYWKKYKKIPQKPWWDQARELYDDPVILKFVERMDEEFHKKTKPKF